MKDKPRKSFEAGVMYQCIKSASPGYQEGSLYISYANENGVVCFEGDDGFEDICSMLVSAFRPISTTELEEICKKYVPVSKKAELGVDNQA